MSLDKLEAFLEESIAVQRSLSPLLPHVARTAELVLASLEAGGKVLACGNGGSAADAQHLTEELIGRYRSNRRPLAAVALTADTQALTCIANDFGYDEIFSRQVTGLGRSEDILVCFSTSGNSPNIIRALEAARSLGMKSVSLMGKDGGKARGMATLDIIVPSSSTARIQEAHTFFLHSVLELVEDRYAAAR